jgi:hypothetical protein
LLGLLASISGKLDDIESNTSSPSNELHDVVQAIKGLSLD